MSVATTGTVTVAGYTDPRIFLNSSKHRLAKTKGINDNCWKEKAVHIVKSHSCRKFSTTPSFTRFHKWESERFLQGSQVRGGFAPFELKASPLRLTQTYFCAIANTWHRSLSPHQTLGISQSLLLNSLLANNCCHQQNMVALYHTFW